MAAQHPRPDRQPSRTQALASIQKPDKTGKRVLLGGCGCFIFILFLMALLSNAGDILIVFLNRPLIAIVAAFAAFLCGIPYAAVILWLDRNEREPFYLLIASFLWGAVVATFVSVIFNSGFLSLAGSLLGDPALARQLTASFSAPPVEETTKALAVLIIFLGFPKHFDNVLDGIIYGAMAGLGFAVYENWMYFVQQPDMGSMAGVIWMRGIVKGLGGSHATYTALFGACLGAFRVLRSGTPRWFLPPAGFALAMVIHFVWNTFAQFIIGLVGAFGGKGFAILIGTPIAILILQTPFLLLIFLTTFLSLRHEDKLIRTYLTSEHDNLVSPDEIDRIVPARRRTLDSLKLLLSFNLDAWWKTRTRNHLLVKLAFQKWHMDQEDQRGSSERAQDYALHVIELRQQLTQHPRPNT